MPKIIGKQIEFGIGVEKVRGVAQLTGEKWVKKITANVVERSEKVSDESTRNVLADSLENRIVTKHIEGDLEGNVQADMIGYLLYNLFGAVSSSNISGSVYEHEFSVQEAIQHASLTLFTKEGAIAQKTFSNCMISSLEINAVVDDYVKFTASFMGKTAANNSDTPSYDTEYQFVGKEITIKIASTEVGLVTATALKAKECTVPFDTGLIKDDTFGSYDPEDIYNGQMMIEGSISLDFEDTTLKDLYLADEFQYMEITITGATDIGGGNYPTITILLNKVSFTDWNREDSAAELVNQPLAFKAFYNESDSQQVFLKLQNVTSEYDTPVSD